MQKIKKLHFFRLHNEIKQVESITEAFERQEKI